MQIQIIRAKSGEPVMYKNVFHAAYVIVKTHGIRGAYQGLPATWLRNIPANSAFFGEFKYTFCTSQSKPRPPPPPRDMWGFSGALSPYWQLFESPVCGGFAHFVAFVLRNVGH